MADIIMCVVTA